MACGDRAIVSVANPVIIGDHSAPQPDFAIFRYRPDHYHHAPRPGPQDTLLLVEVSESSIRYDSGIKLSLYARSGIPDYWIVDLAKRVVRVHRRPGPDDYLDRTTHGAGETLALTGDPAIMVTLDQIFGPKAP